MFLNNKLQLKKFREKNRSINVEFRSIEGVIQKIQDIETSLIQKLIWRFENASDILKLIIIHFI